MKFKKYTCPCKGCGNLTTVAYARRHDGHCKRCEDPDNWRRSTPERDLRAGLIIDAGWEAYAREEGHYD